MNPLAMKRKMFEEMKEVSKSDGADALRAKFSPQEEMPPEEGMEAGMEPDAQPVPGAEEDEAQMAEGEGSAIGSDALDQALQGMSEEELLALLAGG
jgi:hypothetical protein